MDDGAALGPSCLPSSQASLLWAPISRIWGIPELGTSQVTLLCEGELAQDGITHTYIL